MGFNKQIKVAVQLLNCRLQPSMNAQVHSLIKMDEIHNIVAEQNGWGQLENGTWINLDFTVPYITTSEVAKNGMSMAEEVIEEKPRESVTITTADKDLKPAKETKTQPEYKLHKVKKGGISGESLWDIAKEHLGNGERYPEIKKLNNLKSDILRAGMVLKIPTE